MKKIVWEIEYLSLPPVIKYCKKCREKKAFICSGQFRINAQRKSLDIWLIYKCSSCDATWNASLYSRISPQSLSLELLEAFHRNDKMLVEQFAINADLLHKNGVEMGLPSYAIIGEDLSTTEAVTLEIKSKYFVHIKVSAIIREKLHLSQKDYLQLIDNGKIRSISELDLRKCKLNNGITLVFNIDN